MADTQIEWASKVWNPVAGCSVLSAGCSNCYAMRMAKRLAAMGQSDYAGLTKTVNGNAVWTGEGRTRPDKLTEPLGWKRPCRIFVNSMSDLFHGDFTDRYIAAVFAVAGACPQHTFQILTKRPERAAEWFAKFNMNLSTINLMGALPEIPEQEREAVKITNLWPLPNVWLGTSVEDSRVTHRIDELRQVPAAVRFLSLEPLIGPLDDLNLEGIHWVIVGGESGPGARPCDLVWTRSIVEQCKRAGVACFYKQGGLTNACPHSNKGGCFVCFPDDLKVREFPNAIR